MSNPRLLTDPSEYLQLVEKSELLGEEQLEQARRSAADAADAKSLARQLVKDKLLTSWQASQILAGWHALMIGKYRLCRQLGKSQVARVFLAEHSQMGRQVALKTLSRRFTSQPSVVKRFLADARAAAAMDHRNIIHVYDVDSIDDRYFLVMEHVEGSDLETLVRENGPLPPEQAADYIRQAARGLEYAHQRDLLHRDIKPANLMLDKQGTIKVLALGLGELSDLENQQRPDERPDMAAGFPAPEDQAGGDPGPASDIYALGATFYCLLTGVVPTAELGARDLLRRRRDLPEDLARICARMMARDPQKRFATAAAARQALDDWLAENAPEEAAESEQAVDLEDAEEPVVAGVSDFNWAPDTSSQLPAHVAGRLPRRRKASAKASRSDASESAAESPAEEPASPLTVGAVGKGRRKAAPKDKMPRGSKKKASKPPVPESSEESGEEKKETRPLPLGLIIGAGAGAGVVVLLLLGVIGYLLFFRGGDRQAGAEGQVADASAAADPTADNLETDPEDPLETDPEDSLETDQVDPLESDPADPLESGPPVEPGGAAAENAGDVEEPENKAGAAEGMPETAAAGQEPEAAGGETATPPSGDKPATGADADSGSPETDPSQPETEPGQPPAPGENADPAPPVPEPEPKPEPEVKPFEGFPAVIALPTPQESQPGEPFTLGPVRIPEKRLCYVKLRGGENACKGTTSLELKNARNGTAERDWEVFLRTSQADTSEPRKIADLTVQNDQLLFTWTAAAAEEPDAVCLKNCGLSMNVGPIIHQVALRTPVVVEPLTVDLNKSTDMQRINLSTPPEPTAIRFQITSLEGPFPPHVIEPDQPVPVTQGEQTIKLGKEPAEQVLEFQLDLDMKRDLQVTLAPYFRWPLDKKPIQATKKNITTAQRVALERSQLLTAQLEQARQFEKQIQDRQQKQGLAAQISLAEQELAKLETAKQVVEKLAGLYQQLSADARMHFRVTYDAEGIEVVLATSQPK